MHSYVLFCSVSIRLWMKINVAILFNLLRVWVWVCARVREWVFILVFRYFLVLYSLGKGYSKSFLFLAQDKNIGRVVNVRNIENTHKHKRKTTKNTYCNDEHWLRMKKKRTQRTEKALHISSLTVQLIALFLLISLPTRSISQLEYIRCVRVCVNSMWKRILELNVIIRYITIFIIFCHFWHISTSEVQNQNRIEYLSWKA